MKTSSVVHLATGQLNYHSSLIDHAYPTTRLYQNVRCELEKEPRKEAKFRWIHKQNPWKWLCWSSARPETQGRMLVSADIWCVSSEKGWPDPRRVRLLGKLSRFVIEWCPNVRTRPYKQPSWCLLTIPEGTNCSDSWHPTPFTLYNSTF